MNYISLYCKENCLSDILNKTQMQYTLSALLTVCSILYSIDIYCLWANPVGYVIGCELMMPM